MDILLKFQYYDTLFKNGFKIYFIFLSPCSGRKHWDYFVNSYETLWNTIKVSGTCRHWKVCFEQDTCGSFGPIGLLAFLRNPLTWWRSSHGFPSRIAEEQGERLLQIRGPGKNHSQTLVRLYPTTVSSGMFMGHKVSNLRPMANAKAIDTWEAEAKREDVSL